MKKDYNQGYKIICMKLHKEKDKDLIDLISKQENKQAFIKDLLRKEKEAHV